jgi:hypothetical protein
MNEIDPQKLEILRQALPRGLAAGDGGFVDSRGTPDVMPQFAPFRSNTIQNKLRVPSPEFSDPPQVGGAGPKIPLHPFQVVQINNDGNYSYFVNLESNLFSSLSPTSKVAITGLNSPFTLTSGGYIWLGITFNRSGGVTGAFIDNSDTDTFNLSAAPWSDNNAYVEDDGEPEPEGARHQSSRKLIAYIIAGANGEPVVKQVMRNDQVLRSVCINGKPAQYPFAHEGGYPF